MENTPPIVRVMRPFNRFLQNDLATGILLGAAIFAAMLWANSPFYQSYFDLWHTQIGVNIGSFNFNKSLHIWINDLLMAIFFFQIGLEIKREIVAGELSTWKKAVMPFGAAVGGMVLPALIFFSFNVGTASSSGWGIPMATDIALTLGLLSIVKTNISTTLKIFLTAVAVVDDLGAVLVIALFYTTEYSFMMLLIAFGILAILFLANRLGVRSTAFYGIVGVTGLWLSFYYSGIHPTIAGILLAFTIPMKPLISKEKFSNRLLNFWRQLNKAKTGPGPLNSLQEKRIITRIENLKLQAQTPLQDIEDRLAPWVYFLIMPLFAFANGGIHFDHFTFDMFLAPVSLGIIFGLLAGKTIGIFGFTYLLEKLGWGKLQNVSMVNLLGVSLLAGIGFTMSLFITELAFVSEEFAQQAKMAILTASTIAALAGIAVIKFWGKKVDT